MKLAFVVFYFVLSLKWASPSISGLSYMDPLIQRPLNNKLPGEDPCNSLYWYPRQIPEYCYNKVIPKPMNPNPPSSPPEPVPLPPMIPMPLPPIAIPVPIPIPPPIPFPPIMPQFSPPIPMFPPSPQFFPAPFNLPTQQMPVPMPYSAPMVSSNPMNFPRPYPLLPPTQAGLVPGIQGLVTQDGGINILPFSDAYSDMLEKHKQKMIRKRLQKVLDDYEDYPRKRKHRKFRVRYH